MSAIWKWFGVKTLHRVAATGRPIAVDKDYSSSMTLIEERVVVVRGRSPEEAIRKAEAEAKEYSRSFRHRNRYGQQVRSRYLGYCDAYVFDDAPEDRTEVFSETEVVPRRVSDRVLVRRLIGAPESARTFRSRVNISNLLFAGTVPGVRLTRAEKSFVARYRNLKSRT